MAQGGPAPGGTALPVCPAVPMLLGLNALTRLPRWSSA
ncbi:hypothetical protein GZL_02796 [Streptomyces sp. 769]|nr:hypothetical protein GZL_02796 [Streptomyces sp. 769]